MRMTHLRLFIAWFCWLGTGSLVAQVTVYNTSNSGLPDNAVRAIARDGLGRLWLGTDWGLAAYDGTNWTVYQSSNSGLPDNSVRSLAVEGDSTLWIGTFQGGLSRFDGQSWTVWNSSNSSLPEDQVRALAHGPGNTLWVGTGGGLVKIQNGTWRIYDFIAMGHESNNVGAVLPVSADTAWVGMVNGGLAHVMDSTVSVQTISNSGLIDNTITGIVLDSGDDLWCATPAGGLAYNLNLNWLHYNPFNSPNPAYTLNNLLLDPDEDLWIATLDKGVVHYDRQSWTHYDSSNSDVPEKNVRCLWLDTSSMTLWGGTNSSGLFSMQLQSVGRQQESRLPLDLYPQPAKGEVWLDLEPNWTGAAVYLYDAEGRLIRETEWLPGRSLYLDVPDGHYLIQVKKGHLWRSGKLLVCHSC